MDSVDAGRRRTCWKEANAQPIKGCVNSRRVEGDSCSHLPPTHTLSLSAVYTSILVATVYCRSSIQSAEFEGCTGNTHVREQRKEERRKTKTQFV